MIGLVVVSHSRRLAAGVAELAGQMAPSVAIVPSGGDGQGGLGTDYVAVGEAITRADSGSGVVVLFDLGSAKMVADMAAEEAEGSVVVVDAPLVEGAVAAAVRAQGGAGLAEVAAAAVGAGSVSSASVVDGEAVDGEAVRADVELTNSVGLHARPAALVARALAPLDASVVVRFGAESADAKSVLALMGLGAPGGARVEVVASGADAAEAVRRVRELAARGFDE
ncbi:PTS-dependent dihydroxyacetone kinase phosphotransferase subunit DhaM [Saccharothrix sp. 6-C]|uniref:dihydroxyacetone kinase phosphoryl donor subunit DhaM n=1 Tax=Saccharothrix sp. 6-C TaxID=2781735 RepID=UPI001916F180|nr:dihydroxyacetone kinase phosphoryl donor subunit DhaM [Saccharothrix sp. 6-C]QQQ75392.1 PTS-dependent dihydroxyacetone kinase phosphotransferase subunit DhaM [Saccharothrix sp. 6-C]